MSKIRARNRVGQTFGRLTVVAVVGKDKHRTAIMRCQCSCGNVLNVACNSLTSGDTKSCGCLRVDTTRQNRTTHAMRGSPEYGVWAGMLQRCGNPRRVNYRDYGGRGISVCESWLQFENFYKDMGPRPSDKHTLDRIDNNGNYCKENCRWVTRAEQNNNQRSNHLMTHMGETLTLTQWSEKLGLSRSTIYYRLSSGKSVEESLAPVIKKGKADVE